MTDSPAQQGIRALQQRFIGDVIDAQTPDGASVELVAESSVELYPFPGQGRADRREARDDRMDTDVQQQQRKTGSDDD